MNRSILIAVAVMSALALGGFFTLRHFMGRAPAQTALTPVSLSKSDARESASTTLVRETLPETSLTNGTRRIQHPKYHFTLAVSSTTQIERYDEGGDSETLLFTDEQAGTEFQLFVTPYAQKEITKGRLSTDIKSGDIREPTEIVLQNGTHAMMFWSHAPLIGESREVWFIHDGYLYEMTVARELDSWLAGILNTIVFDPGA